MPQDFHGPGAVRPSGPRASLENWARVAMLLLLLLAGCTRFVRSVTPMPPAPTSVPVDSSGWQSLAPGLDQRTLAPSSTNLTSQIIALRVNPQYFQFRVHYQPGQRLSFQRWREALPGVVAFINGNFFDPQGHILGLLVSDGVSYGHAYSDRGGMFQVQNGQPRVRSTLAEPYQGEPLEQAVQAFPMLVANRVATYNAPNDTDVSRRTVVGQDSAGRILFLVTTWFGMRLSEISAYLPTTDLDLVNAVNLDGGRSTMLYVGAGPTPFTLPSFDTVPAVLAVYPR